MNKRVLLGSLGRLVVCIAYGMLVGYLAITAAESPNGAIDNSSYQNFSIAIGAIIGLSFFIIGNVIYLLFKRRTKWERLDFLLNVVTGVVIGFVSSFVVHVSADSYGLINANVPAIIIGCLVPAIIGGALPAIVLSLVKA